jgi:hypothetical protein
LKQRQQEKGQEEDIIEKVKKCEEQDLFAEQLKKQLELKQVQFS